MSNPPSTIADAGYIVGRNLLIDGGTVELAP